MVRSTHDPARGAATFGLMARAAWTGGVLKAACRSPRSCALCTKINYRLCPLRCVSVTAQLRYWRAPTVLHAPIGNRCPTSAACVRRHETPRLARAQLIELWAQCRRGASENRSYRREQKWICHWRSNEYIFNRCRSIWQVHFSRYQSFNQLCVR
jgi:hypothetical protein